MPGKFVQYKVLGPKLFKEYGQKLYEPNSLEKWGDQIITTMNFIWNLGIWTSPLVLIYVYRKNYLVVDNLPCMAKVSGGVCALALMSFILRGIGRSSNETYSRFSKVLEMARNVNKSEDVFKGIRKFDFEFSAFPVDYVAAEIVADEKEKNTTVSASAPVRILGYLAIHTFGLKMIYPGSIKLLQGYLHSALLQGRSKLVEEEGGVRYKIQTGDGNEIDTMFVDNRGKSPNGTTLVLCSEGNAGFYEIGIMTTPLELKYSVIGWNHPGFGGSTGQPYPEQDKNAVDSVLRFAIDTLNFKPSQIILNGWSIGAFSTLILASQNDDIRGVLLDATFDDMLPLALPRMPESLGPIVRVAVRNNVNLHNSELIKQYRGPVMLIRRTEDEIICSEEGVLASNRGNFLLISLLKFRFPNLVQGAQETYALEILTKPLDRAPLDAPSEALCNQLLESYFAQREKTYPVYIGEDLETDHKNKLVLYLIKSHLLDFKSSHCTPLPAEYFAPNNFFDIQRF